MSENSNIEKISDNKLSNITGGLYLPRRFVTSEIVGDDTVRGKGEAIIDSSKKKRDEHKSE